MNARGRARRARLVCLCAAAAAWSAAARSGDAPTAAPRALGPAHDLHAGLLGGRRRLGVE